MLALLKKYAIKALKAARKAIAKMAANMRALVSGGGAAYPVSAMEQADLDDGDDPDPDADFKPSENELSPTEAMKLKQQGFEPTFVHNFANAKTLDERKGWQNMMTPSAREWTRSLSESQIGILRKMDVETELKPHLIGQTPHPGLPPRYKNLPRDPMPNPHGPNVAKDLIHDMQNGHKPAVEQIKEMKTSKQFQIAGNVVNSTSREEQLEASRQARKERSAAVRSPALDQTKKMKPPAYMFPG